MTRGKQFIHSALGSTTHSPPSLTQGRRNRGGGGEGREDGERDVGGGGGIEREGKGKVGWGRYRYCGILEHECYMLFFRFHDCKTKKKCVQV